MRKKLMWVTLISLSAACLPIGQPLAADPAKDIAVPLQQTELGTYYLSARLGDLNGEDFLVDTGSAYTVISEKTFSALEQKQQIKHLKDIEGIMADGSTRKVPLYIVTSLDIGGKCTVQDVIVAVIPGSARPILGMSALSKVAPFVFSLTPATLTVKDYCQPGLQAQDSSPVVAKM
ncbi:MAG: retropepsin-like aspartic protease [Methylococcus sp.]|nr:retropepsin-like aspartic protease [Methylococcus sp.]